MTRFRFIVAALMMVPTATMVHGDERLPVVKLSPKIRHDNARGQDYFAALDCTAASEEAARTADEQRWLDLRRQQCARKWKAFIR